MLTIAETGGTNGYRARRGTDPGFAMIRPQVKLGTGMAGRQAMKTLIVAVAMLALIAMPAHDLGKCLSVAGEMPSQQLDIMRVAVVGCAARRAIGHARSL